MSAMWTRGRVPSTHGLDTAPVVGDRSRVVGGGISVMVAGAHKDVVWDAGAGRDPRREALDIEAAIADALARNTRLRHHRIMVTAGPDGLVTLTGSVSTQSLRREVELVLLDGVRGPESARRPARRPLRSTHRRRRLTEPPTDGLGVVRQPDARVREVSGRLRAGRGRSR